MTLRDLPPVRALAAERARERYFTEARVAYGADLLAVAAWEEHEHREFRIAVELAILADLTRRASRNDIVELIAAKVGLVCGATAPDFARFVCGEHCCDGVRGRMVPCSRPIWSMMGADETQMVTFADCPDPDEWDGDERRHVPGVSAITDPAEALRLIALAVLA